MIFLFPTRLKALRKSMNLPQEQLARLLDVDRSTISSYESSLRQPSLGTLSRIADVFGVSTDYLLGRTNNLSSEVFVLEGEEAALLYRMAVILTQKNGGTLSATGLAGKTAPKCRLNLPNTYAQGGNHNVP